MTSVQDIQAMMPPFSMQQVSLTIVGPRVGMLKSGVMGDASFTITSDLFYDAVFIGSIANSTTEATDGPMNSAMALVMEAYGHGKPIAALGMMGQTALQMLGIQGQAGVYSGSATAVTQNVLAALSGPAGL